MSALVAAAPANFVRNSSSVPLSRFGAPIVQDVTGLFLDHARQCTACTVTVPCRDGDAVVSNFMKTSASYFNSYQK